MFYAVKSVDGALVNTIYSEWEDCKPIVFGKNSLYQACVDRESAQSYLASINDEKVGVSLENINSRLITVTFLFHKFKNENTGYSCSVYKTKRGKHIVCRGYGLPENKRLYYNFGGEFKMIPHYGYEFEVESFKEVISDAKEDIITYLSSGIIKGVGVKKAEAIYAEFGSRTTYILENQPERLKYVKGFSEKSAKEAIEQLNSAKETKELTQFLLHYGISQKYAMDLFKVYGRIALSKIRANPYILCSYSSITFEDAEIMAKDTNYPKDGKERLTYAAFHMLKENELSGNTGMAWEDFARVYQKMCGIEVSRNRLSDHIKYMCDKKLLTVKKIKYGEAVKSVVFARVMYDIENCIAEDIIRIRDAKNEMNVDLPTCGPELRGIEDWHGIKLDELQRKAVIDSVTKNNITVITGGPGTGKTSVIQAAADLYETAYSKIILLAPTGRAARRIAEVTGREAHTVHSYLHIFNTDESMEPEEKVVIEDAYVVVDEFSMVDVYIAEQLFSSIGKNCHVVIVGDTDQLPSVGPGAVLRDIIESNTVPVVRLTTTYRQKDDERIAENAQMINSGDGNIIDGTDFHSYHSGNMEDIRNMMAELYIRAMRKYGIENVMCLCPYIENPAGVKDMNTLLQTLLNDEEEGKKELKVRGEVFRVGDPVMHLKNDENAANGDIGIIEDVDTDNKKIIAHINNKSVEYTHDDLNKLQLAYASTIHKAQGSEADAVIFCFTSRHKKMLYRNLPYVAISRGKKEVFFVGEKEALIEAAKNKAKNERITLTGKLLRAYDGQFVEA